MPEVRLAESDAEIERCFPVIHQLRPALVAGEFVGRIRTQEAEGYRLAFLEDEGRVVSVAGFRLMTVLWSGRTLYVDDLVTTGTVRFKSGSIPSRFTLGRFPDPAFDLLNCCLQVVGNCLR